jgi:flagellar protein FliO/FliZ
MVCETASDRRANRRRWIALTLAVLVFAFIVPTTIAQATRPVAASFEDEPLNITDTRRPANFQSPNDPKPGQNSASDLQRVGLALAIVIGAIFLLRWVARKMFLLPAAGAGRANKGVKVLSRSILAPKQQLLLLQVGKRVLVVGDSAGHMSALCEITEPDEVAALVGEVTQDQPASKRSFGKLFGQAKEPFDAAAAADMNIEPATELGISDHADIGGLMEKIRGMQRQFKK